MLVLVLLFFFPVFLVLFLFVSFWFWSFWLRQKERKRPSVFCVFYISFCFFLILVLLFLTLYLFFTAWKTPQRLFVFDIVKNSKKKEKDQVFWLLFYIKKHNKRGVKTKKKKSKEIEKTNCVCFLLCFVFSVFDKVKNKDDLFFYYLFFTLFFL